MLAPNVHIPATSGAALAPLVLDPDLATTAGAYFDAQDASVSSEESYAGAPAMDIWTVSAELVQRVRMWRKRPQADPTRPELRAHP